MEQTNSSAATDSDDAAEVPGTEVPGNDGNKSDEPGPGDPGSPGTLQDLVADAMTNDGDQH